MAYEVTATRRRPQRFEDLIGQEFVTATLINAIQSGKIAHAYLFSGPRGCGKTSSARILAKALNCEQGPSGTPCGECPACREIIKGSCMDVIEIDGASNTSVNDVRQIKEEVLFPPHSCRYKVYIIDEVHMLSTSAFNALLKTIEEPPPYVIFIFATTELHKVPATIKSRCQQFNFKLGDIEKIKQLLADTCRETGMTAEDEALFWIARESTGSFRDAYTLFDQVAAFSNNDITFDKIKEKLGLVGLEQMNAIAEACVAGDTGAVLTVADEVLQNGISLEQFISDLTDYFRSLLLLKNGIAKESLLGHNPSRFSAAACSCWTPIQLERAVALLLDVFRDIRYSVNPRYELDVALSRLSWLKEYVSPAEIKKALDSAQRLLQKGAPSANAQEAGRPFPVSSPENPAGDSVRGTEVPAARTPSAAKNEDINPFDTVLLKWKHPVADHNAVAPDTPAEPAAMSGSTAPFGGFSAATPGAVPADTATARNDAPAADPAMSGNTAPFGGFSAVTPGAVPADTATDHNAAPAADHNADPVADHTAAAPADPAMSGSTAPFGGFSAATPGAVPADTTATARNADPVADHNAVAPAEPAAMSGYIDDGEMYVEIPQSYIDDTARNVAQPTAAVAPERPAPPLAFGNTETSPPLASAAPARRENPVIGADELRDKLTAYFSEHDNDLMVSKLEALSGWDMRDGDLILQANSAFLAAYLEKELQLISKTIAEITGTAIHTKIEMIQQQKEFDTKKSDIPETVNLICTMFRGTVVSGGSK